MKRLQDYFFSPVRLQRVRLVYGPSGQLLPPAGKRSRRGTPFITDPLAGSPSRPRGLLICRYAGKTGAGAT